MAKPRFLIQKERLPVRCEICHQPDRFDANTGVCERCAPLYPVRDQFSQSGNVFIESREVHRTVAVQLGNTFRYGFIALALPGALMLVTAIGNAVAFAPATGRIFSTAAYILGFMILFAMAVTTFCLTLLYVVTIAGNVVLETTDALRRPRPDSPRSQ